MARLFGNMMMQCTFFHLLIDDNKLSADLMIDKMFNKKLLASG